MENFAATRCDDTEMTQAVVAADGLDDDFGVVVGRVLLDVDFRRVERFGSVGDRGGDRGHGNDQGGVQQAGAHVVLLLER